MYLSCQIGFIVARVNVFNKEACRYRIKAKH